MLVLYPVRIHYNFRTAAQAGKGSTVIENEAQHRSTQNGHGQDKEVHITVNTKPVTVLHRTTASEIMSLASVPSDFTLYIVRGSQEDPVGVGEIEVHEGERFIASPTLDPS